jgi:uncharacterized membrane protein YoaK (UPF0700 family)
MKIEAKTKTDVWNDKKLLRKTIQNYSTLMIIFATIGAMGLIFEQPSIIWGEIFLLYTTSLLVQQSHKKWKNENENEMV